MRLSARTHPILGAVGLEQNLTCPNDSRYMNQLLKGPALYGYLVSRHAES